MCDLSCGCLVLCVSRLVFRWLNFELLLRQAVVLWFLLQVLQVGIESESLRSSTNAWMVGTQKRADPHKKL
jgi:hypothetical protein